MIELRKWWLTRHGRVMPVLFVKPRQADELERLL